MKIVVVANGYPTPQDPQWGCFERDQAVALYQFGHDVSVIAFDSRFRRYRRKHGITVIQQDGFMVFWGYWFPTGLIGKISMRLRDKITYRFFDILYSRLIKKWGKPDLLFAHYQRNIYYSLYLGKKYDIPIVGMEHWSALMEDQPPTAVLQRGKIAYPVIDKLLTVSSALSESIKTKFGVESEVINDMLGPEFLEYIPGPGRVDDGIRFIAVGSLFPIKRYDLLIKAFAGSGLAEKNCSLLIVGDGTERQTLEQIIEEHGLKDSVSLPGRKQKDDIVRALRDSDVFVLSSRSETFGVACIEALSQGLPCIATRCGGPEEFVTDKDGILIPSEDQKEMEKALLYMYDNHSKYDRNDISSRCLSRFSPTAIAGQLTDIFKEVINNHKDNK